MQINLQAKNIEITESIGDYVEKKVTNLGKILIKMEEKGGEVMVNFEVEKTTNHHKAGDIYKASCLIDISGQSFHASSEKHDLYGAIDDVKEALFREIGSAKDRKQTLFKRGATKVKKLLRASVSFYVNNR